MAETVNVQWLWDQRYIDAPVLRWRDADADPQTGQYGLDETLYYCNDANMNVTALVDAETGEVVERYMYDPYGKATVCDEDWTPREGNASAVANDVLYCGYRFDAETGLYNVRFRYYHPTLGRWIERDPGLDEFRSTMYVSQYSDGMGLYQYVRSGPANRVDPSGLWGEDVHRRLTQKLAKEAGFDDECAAKIGDWTNAPDTDFWSRPGEAGVADLANLAGLAVWLGPVVAGLLVKKKWDSMAEWHFPVSPDGLVHPDSDAAKKKLNEGLAKCDLEAFSRGLHVYQDSWSHAGKPFIRGIGHHRGVIPLPQTVYGFSPPGPLGTGGWTPVGVSPYTDVSRSALAAVLGSADEPGLWSEDFNAMEAETKQKLKDFFKECPCACPSKEAPPPWIGYYQHRPYGNPIDINAHP